MKTEKFEKIETWLRGEKKNLDRPPASDFAAYVLGKLCEFYPARFDRDGIVVEPAGVTPSHAWLMRSAQIACRELLLNDLSKQTQEVIDITPF